MPIMGVGPPVLYLVIELLLLSLIRCLMLKRLQEKCRLNNLPTNYRGWELLYKKRKQNTEMKISFFGILLSYYLPQRP